MSWSYRWTCWTRTTQSWWRLLRRCNSRSRFKTVLFFTLHSSACVQCTMWPNVWALWKLALVSWLIINHWPFPLQRVLRNKMMESCRSAKLKMSFFFFFSACTTMWKWIKLGMVPLLGTRWKIWIKSAVLIILLALSSTNFRVGHLLMLVGISLGSPVSPQ